MIAQARPVAVEPIVTTVTVRKRGWEWAHTAAVEVAAAAAGGAHHRVIPEWNHLT